VNWFRRDASGRYLWPGYGENLRPLLWLLDLAAGRVTGIDTPIGTMPRPEELPLDGLALAPADLGALLTLDLPAWQREAAARGELLKGFPRLPAPIAAAHERLVAAVAVLE
jgi:phosphoenolpyruvate carboxykinase (GTP)